MIDMKIALKNQTTSMASSFSSEVLDVFSVWQVRQEDAAESNSWGKA